MTSSSSPAYQRALREALGWRLSQPTAPPAIEGHRLRRRVLAGLLGVRLETRATRDLTITPPFHDPELAINETNSTNKSGIGLDEDLVRRHSLVRDDVSLLSPSDEPSMPAAEAPWSESEIWRPHVALRHKSPKRHLTAVVACLALVVAAVGLGLVPGSSVIYPAANSDMVPQARQVDWLLAQMTETRSELGSVVIDGCTTSGLQRVYDQRQRQFGEARNLYVSALDNGIEMKDALVRALQAAISSTQRYLEVSPGCPSDSEVAEVNQRAADTKREFISYWNPIAQQANLPARSADTI